MNNALQRRLVWKLSLHPVRGSNLSGLVAGFDRIDVFPPSVPHTRYTASRKRCQVANLLAVSSDLWATWDSAEGYWWVCYMGVCMYFYVQTQYFTFFFICRSRFIRHTVGCIVRQWRVSTNRWTIIKSGLGQRWDNRISSSLMQSLSSWPGIGGWYVLDKIAITIS